MGNPSKGHAIMISLPFQGHINPFTSLALNLASKGFTVTFVHLEFIHYKLSNAHTAHPDFFSEARKSGLDIRYTTIHDGFPLEFDRDLHLSEYWESMLRDFPARADTFVGETIDQSIDAKHFLVTDTLYSWPATIADKYKIVNVSFWTEPALVFSLLYHWDLLTENGHFPFKDVMEEINYVPGVKSIHTKDLMSYLTESETKTLYRLLSPAFAQVKKADFILHNTVEELEPDVLSALNRYIPTYAIGPINFSKCLPRTSLLSESDCTRWLESKPPGSVLYVSFGSIVRAEKWILEEIAHGLVLSEVNFVWAIRPGILRNSDDDDDDDGLPVGFKDGVGDKGVIVPWCDQITVLSNPAVGGFLTHNGWNSTVESMWCGVPMICYPIRYDQPTNRKLVVDDWEIGINLCDGECVDRVEVAEKIKSLMCGDCVSNRLKANAKEVKGVLQRALDIGGSFDTNFDRFVRDLEERIEVKS